MENAKRGRERVNNGKGREGMGDEGEGRALHRRHH